MKIVAIIQARVSSTRLPRKVLLPILGRPLLLHVVDRVRASRVCDAVVVATSTHSSDKAIATLCCEEAIPCFRGSLDDVLRRYRDSAEAHSTDAVVRITADCPFLDPAVVAKVVTAFREGDADYCSNTLHPTYPDGLDTEVFTMEALRRTDEEAHLPSEREHVTPYITYHPDRFRLRSVESSESHAGLRWTVDEPQDLAFIQAVAEHLGRFPLGMDELLALLRKHPTFGTINAGIGRNEGYTLSSRRDGPIASPVHS